MHFSVIKKKNRNKKTTTTLIGNELKYSPLSEGNTCIAEQNLAVLPLR